MQSDSEGSFLTLLCLRMFIHSAMSVSVGWIIFLKIIIIIFLILFVSLGYEYLHRSIGKIRCICHQVHLSWLVFSSTSLSVRICVG